MAFESDYKLQSVAATRIAADKIDETFKSSTIGEFVVCVNCGGRTQGSASASDRVGTKEKCVRERLCVHRLIVVSPLPRLLRWNTVSPFSCDNYLTIY